MLDTNNKGNWGLLGLSKSRLVKEPMGRGSRPRAGGPAWAQARREARDEDRPRNQHSRDSGDYRRHCIHRQLEAQDDVYTRPEDLTAQSGTCNLRRAAEDVQPGTCNLGRAA